MRNCLVVFYSRTGRTKLVAFKIAQMLNCEIEEIVDLKNRSGIVGWLISGFDAATKKLTTINPITKNLDSYDNIILCSPVWASSVPPAVRTFLITFKEKIKNISCVATMSGIGANKMFKEVEALSGKNLKAAVAIKTIELKTENYLEKLRGFINQL